MQKLIFLDKEENSAFLKNFAKQYNIKFYKEGIAEVADKVKNAKIISCRSKSKFTKDVFEKLPNLKCLITRTVGTDHIDLEEAKKRGIIVKNILDYGSNYVAEHAFALLLSGIRNIKKADKKVRSGKFNFLGLKGFGLKDKTFGVIGTGRIGEAAMNIAKGFGMNAIAYDVFKKPGINYVELDELLKKSDIITIHVPLLDQTKQMINESAIQKMKEGVIFINIARGELVDTNALIKNINKFRFVGLDVLEDENKFTKDHPLLKFKNVLITPHIAFYTEETLKNTYDITMQYVKEFLNDKKE